MAESLSSAELLWQLKSLGMARLLHAVNAFLRQSYIYPPLLTFGGKTSFVSLVDVPGLEVRASLQVLSPSSGSPAPRAPDPLAEPEGRQRRSGRRGAVLWAGAFGATNIPCIFSPTNVPLDNAALHGENHARVPHCRKKWFQENLEK